MERRLSGSDYQKLRLNNSLSGPAVDAQFRRVTISTIRRPSLLLDFATRQLHDHQRRQRRGLSRQV